MNRQESISRQPLILLGGGYRYMKETGQIFVGINQVSKLGYQSNIIFERLVINSGFIVNKVALAKVSGLIETDYISDYDIRRVESTVRRIKKTLKIVDPKLANRLKTVHLKGYYWNSSNSRSASMS